MLIIYYLKNIFRPVWLFKVLISLTIIVLYIVIILSENPTANTSQSFSSNVVDEKHSDVTQ